MPMLKTGVSGSASASVGSGAGANRAGAAQRFATVGAGGWHPTVAYMLGLIILEVLIVAWLSNNLLKG